METIKKYTREIIIVGLIILLLSVSYCSHNQQKLAEGEKEVLKEQLVEQKKSLKDFKAVQKTLFDSISAQEKIKDIKIAELQDINKIITKKSEENLKKLRDKQKQIASFDNAESADYINVYFQGLDAIPTQTSVNLENNYPNLVVAELEEKQYLEKEIVLRDYTITNKDYEIKLTQEKVLSRDLVIASKQIETEKLDSALKLSEDINKKSDKVIRKLKTKNFINRILVPVALGVGVFTGIIIAK